MSINYDARKVYDSIRSALSEMGHPFSQNEFEYHVRLSTMHITPKPVVDVPTDRVPEFERRINEAYRRLSATSHFPP